MEQRISDLSSMGKVGDQEMIRLQTGTANAAAGETNVSPNSQTLLGIIAIVPVRAA